MNNLPVKYPPKVEFKFIPLKQRKSPIKEVLSQLKNGFMQVTLAIVGMFGALLLEGGGFVYSKPKLVLKVLCISGLFLSIAASAINSLEKPPQQETLMCQLDTLCTSGNEQVQVSTKKDRTTPMVHIEENEAAPMVPPIHKAVDVSVNEYIERFHKIAIGEMKEFGVPASISLAQGIIESRSGMSKLAVNNNNHFGIKCFSKQCGKGHCSNFTDDTHKDFFRKFKSPWESWRAHSQLLASGRYTKLKKYGRDYRKWAYGLKSAGYATDRTYAEKLIGVIERFNLHKYDK